MATPAHSSWLVFQHSPVPGSCTVPCYLPADMGLIVHHLLSLFVDLHHSYCSVRRAAVSWPSCLWSAAPFLQNDLVPMLNPAISMCTLASCDLLYIVFYFLAIVFYKIWTILHKLRCKVIAQHFLWNIAPKIRFLRCPVIWLTQLNSA